MILSGQAIREQKIIKPFSERTKFKGTTFGIGPAGYDLCLILKDNRPSYRLRPGDFILAATKEQFTMPNDVLGIVHDKSSWARRGVTVQNTVIEPGWRGYLTLEIKNIGHEDIELTAGQGIAQVIFHRIDKIVAQPYEGRYQDQEFGPQEARP